MYHYVHVTLHVSEVYVSSHVTLHVSEVYVSSHVTSHVTLHVPGALG